MASSARPPDEGEEEDFLLDNEEKVAGGVERDAAHPSSNKQSNGSFLQQGELAREPDERVPWGEIADEQAERTAQALGGRRSGDGWSARCPAHDDHDPSLSITARDGKVLVHCFSGCEQGAVLDALRERGLWTDKHDHVRVARERRWVIRDVDGTVVAIHVRINRADGSKKAMPWELPGGLSGLGGLKVTELPLYGSERLRDLLPGATVLLTEGEKAADALTSLGVLAVGTVTGAGKNKPIPSDDVLQVLLGHEVVLWPDHDGVGYDHMRRIAARLRVLGGRVRTLRWPDARDSGDDAADFRSRGGTREELDALVAAAADAASKGEGAGQPGGAQAAGAEGPRATLVLSNVKPEPVAWLWQDKIPLGKVTVLEGDPDTGKTTLAIDIAARLSAGRAMPLEDEALLPASGVVVLTAEDDLADTIRPRFAAAGADLDRVLAFQIDSLPDLDAEGIDAVSSAIASIGARLVIVDPLMAFVPDKTDSHRDHHMRRILTPLAALAQRTGAAILVVRHLNKSGGTNAKYRGGGSIGITGAARSVMMAAVDPEDESRRILARVKCNVAPPWPSISYTLEPCEAAVRIAWGETTPRTADSILATRLPNDAEREDDRDEREDDRSALDEACRWLVEVLRTGFQLTATIKAAAKQAGIGWRTVERAKKRLRGRVIATKDGLQGPWGWKLTTNESHDEDRQDLDDEEGWRCGGL